MYVRAMYKSEDRLWAKPQPILVLPRTPRPSPHDSLGVPRLSLTPALKYVTEDRLPIAAAHSLKTPCSLNPFFVTPNHLSALLTSYRRAYRCSPVHRAPCSQLPVASLHLRPSKGYEV